MRSDQIRFKIGVVARPRVDDGFAKVTPTKASSVSTVPAHYLSLLHYRVGTLVLGCLLIRPPKKKKT